MKRELEKQQASLNAANSLKTLISNKGSKSWDDLAAELATEKGKK